ncbi:hypothetical protein PVK06_011894 [Gossypium arboreum]|uniref:Uncharacterized protein n=1 Tax=Gossypium arboreum TaxID=29729 RepID=A0ABR0Q9Y1_GOSAR|nr:hypothetical protein PVK06_011894 [Gossypium arboreum]
MKMPLVVYVIVDLHESDRVLQQFGFKQPIPPAPQDIKDLHHINLWGRTDANWPTFHVQYIKIWNNRVYGKPYLFGEEARGRQLHTRRPRQLYPYADGVTNTFWFIVLPRSSLQPLIPRSEDTRWKSRTNQLQSTTDEGKEDTRPIP